ncbi:hypothetical protein CROQUDRAFT_92937 [Cronartium quercuum f. sp. fusiforme G11]|uniref:Uncharacterized protein n=1 Tax=Cronartium quercuum f. sp. fusiforme G11 TaxID=708437 RepID=A0A9P6TD18_9BASI|nr:hypothetical protein CROQUDRAFT_92937 [Cronartium quercuum f. sp. fusiforme G11]
MWIARAVLLITRDPRDIEYTEALPAPMQALPRDQKYPGPGTTTPEGPAARPEHAHQPTRLQAGSRIHSPFLPVLPSKTPSGSLRTAPRTPTVSLCPTKLYDPVTATPTNPPPPVPWN